MSETRGTNEAVQVAEEIAEAMGVRALAVKMVHGMLEPILAGPRAAGQDLGPVRTRVEGLVDRLPLRSTVVTALGGAFTHDELVALRDFYFSPIGQRWSRFAVDEAETISGLCTRWALAALLLPALRSAGVDDATARSMGLPIDLTVATAEWGGVDDDLRARAVATVRACGFTRRIDDLVSAQLAQIGALGDGFDAAKVEAGLDKSVPLEQVARLYATAFSRAELDEIAGFCTTPIGQRSIELAPLLERAGAEAMQSWMAANPGALEEELRGIAALVA